MAPSSSSPNYTNNIGSLSVPISQMDTYSSGDEDEEYSSSRHNINNNNTKTANSQTNNTTTTIQHSTLKNSILMNNDHHQRSTNNNNHLNHHENGDQNLEEAPPCYALPYYETENPLKNRIGQITMSDISPRGHAASPVDAKKMERRRSLQLKIKKPGNSETVMSNVNRAQSPPAEPPQTTLALENSSVDSNEPVLTPKAKTTALQIAAIPKLNLGKVEHFKDDNDQYTGSSSSNEDHTSSSSSNRDLGTHLDSTTEISLNSLSTTNSSSTLTTPKEMSSSSQKQNETTASATSTSAMIRKYKRPHTSRESRSELQYIVATSSQSGEEFEKSNFGETKSKQIAKLLLLNKASSQQQQQQTTSTTPAHSVTSSSSSKTNVPSSGNSSPTKVQIQRNLKRHSVAREFHSLQEYLQSRIKEQQQLMAPPPSSPMALKNQPHDFSNSSTIATPRSSALQTKLLNMANNLKRTSQVLELNEQLLKEEKRKSAQAWTLLSTLEDDHSMSQLKYEELKFHYELKCEELKHSKKHMEEMEAQIKKLEGNYNFLDQEKIRLQREVQELKRALELKEQEGQRRRCCCIM
ncbi:hypothetical protein C9374_008732 [Naegleria lovaniensis]|uniref:Uncharacterized protein n=1 Tax=Naegleria lovaniensis TaxID=51637 RepID=A0AA88GJU1_NAELO|nr:uncharacterized protein C9374_008732 [Naegleria lovaniensis]KAG2378110.1 hypothetical protein C9374_008732 [Naegleria lovaniensis]